MDDEPQFIAKLERALVDGARHYAARRRRRRRAAIAAASLSLVALGVAGVIAVQRGGGSSDGSATAPTLSQVDPTGTPSATTGMDRGPTGTIPVTTTTTSTSSTTTSTSSTSTSTSTTTTSSPTTTNVSTSPGPPCDPAHDNDDQFPLRRCDSGWGVVWVYQALAARGDLPHVDYPVHLFTDEVEDAVRRFQQASGLEVDGLVGPRTWFALYPEFLDVGSDLAEFDFDGDGRIEPFEVGAMGDSNSVCDVPTADDCPPTSEP